MRPNELKGDARIDAEQAAQKVSDAAAAGRTRAINSRAAETQAGQEADAKALIGQVPKDPRAGR